MNRTHYEVLVIQFLLPDVLELRKRRVVWYGAITVSALLGLTVARLRRRKCICMYIYVSQSLPTDLESDSVYEMLFLCNFAVMFTLWLDASVHVGHALHVTFDQ